jgi:hypothetical protein
LADDGSGCGYRFETDSAKAIAASSASAPIPEGEKGRVSPERVQAVVRARFGAIKACYDAGLANDPKLAGIVTVKAVIGKDGVARDAVDDASTLPDRAVVGCVVREFGKLTYAPGSGVTTVASPIELAP